MTNEQHSTNLRSMKTDNQRLLLRLLHEGGPGSRKELAEQSGLTPAAVTKLTAELIAAGYVKEQGQLSDGARAGRREIRLRLPLDELFLLGVYMELDAVTFSVSRMDGRFLTSVRRPYPKDPVALAALPAQCFDMEFSLFLPRIRCIGVCVVGDANENGFGLWRTEEIKSAFEARYRLPVLIENNVKAFVLAALLYGKNRFRDRALFFKWGPGVGSAFYAGGSILSGDAGSVAEIGHYIADPGGKRCRCGRYGCLETVCAERALLTETGEPDLDALLKNDDPAVKALLDQKIDTVALALTNTSTIFSTRNVVLFGSMFRSAEIVQKLKKQMLRYNQNLAEEKIVLSQLNPGIATVSPAAVAAEQFFFSLQEETL